MAIENAGILCPVCMEGHLHDGMKQKTYTYKGHSMNYSLAGAWCDHCDDGIVTGAEAEAANVHVKAFRNEINQKIGRQLAGWRVRTGMTQEEAARYTGGGHNAFSRYERGEAAPVVAVANLFHLLAQHPELKSELLTDDTILSDAPTP